MHEWKDTRTNKCMNERIQGLMNAWINEYTDIECMNERIQGLINAWIKGYKD